MSQQHRVQAKRKRRKAYLKRKKAAAKSIQGGQARAKSRKPSAAVE